jgi:hypothetical protein
MTIPSGFSRLLEWWDDSKRRHPLLGWLERWGISVSSLLLGLLTIFFFRRGIEYFPWFIGYLLVLWVAGVVCLEARQSLAVRSPRVVSLVVDYAVQTMLHGVFLFLVPIYYASTTLASRNVSVLLLLLAGVILTGVDPWYRALFRRCQWIEVALFWLGLFASLNVALPLIRVQVAWALILSGVSSVGALTPSVRRRLGVDWRTAAALTAVAASAAGLLLWSARSWIPPAPLYLARGTFAQAVDRLEPIEPVREASAAEVSTWGGLSVFTAVVAPDGLRQPIDHVWWKDGIALRTIRLSPIRGGAHTGFRTHSRKFDLGPDPAGLWEVDVVTSLGQLIGRVRLTVRP